MKVIPARLPSLAPPGAGLPPVERVAARLIFAIRCWRGTRQRVTEEFRRERDAIGRLYGSRGEAVLGERVLIPRLRGLEDSSRFWSVYMTLDHLRIVNDEISRVIGALTCERMPEGQASTAAVKPSPDVGPDVVADYEAACDRLASLIASTPQLRTRLRYPHPWFGPLDGSEWHAMAAMHMGVHRAQVARILETSGRAS